MKIAKDNLDPKKIAALAVVLVLLIGSGAVAYYNFLSPQSDTNNQQEERDETNSDDSKEDPSDEDQDPVYDESNPARDNTNTSQSPSNTGHSQQPISATINIPSYQAENGRINVNVAISEPWGQDASCTMQIQGPLARTVTETVFAQAQISGCNLEASDLPSGAYHVTIFAEHGDQKTNVETLNVTL